MSLAQASGLNVGGNWNLPFEWRSIEVLNAAAVKGAFGITAIRQRSGGSLSRHTCAAKIAPLHGLSPNKGYNAEMKTWVVITKNSSAPMEIKAEAVRMSIPGVLTLHSNEGSGKDVSTIVAMFPVDAVLSIVDKSSFVA